MHYQTGTEKWEIKNSYANHVIQDYKNKHDNTQNSHSVDNSKNIDIMNSNDTTHQ